MKQFFGILPLDVKIGSDTTYYHFNCGPLYPKGNIPLMTSKQSPSGHPAIQPFHTVLVRAKLNTVRSGPADGADGPDA